MKIYRVLPTVLIVVIGTNASAEDNEFLNESSVRDGQIYEAILELKGSYDLEAPGWSEVTDDDVRRWEDLNRNAQKQTAPRQAKPVFENPKNNFQRLMNAISDAFR